MSRPIRDLNNSANLSDKHLQAIGEVAVRWAELEGNIKEIIWDLANIRHTSALAITTHLSESNLVNIAKALVDLLVSGPQEQLADEINGHLNFIIGKLYPKRNTMVHSTWGISHEPGKTQTLPITARGVIKFGPRKDYSSDDIAAIAEEIYDANVKLYEYVSRLKQLIPTWHHIKRDYT